eukprot:SAG11_NODE_6853_length_1235_cov_1.566021_3_plen_106_part_01
MNIRFSTLRVIPLLTAAQFLEDESYFGFDVDAEQTSQILDDDGGEEASARSRRSTLASPGGISFGMRSRTSSSLSSQGSVDSGDAVHDVMPPLARAISTEVDVAKL